MTKLEAIAAKFELTVDYVMDEFVIDNELYCPSLYLITNGGDVFFQVFRIEVKTRI